MRGLHYIIPAIFLCGLALPGAALCQALPWQQSSPQPQVQAPSQQQIGQPVQQMSPAQPAQPHHHTYQAASPPPAPSGDNRTADDMKLNKLAGRFYALHEKDVNAIVRMKALEKEVGGFAKSLRTNPAEADISHDAQHLLDRIVRQRKEWEARAAH